MNSVNQLISQNINKPVGEIRKLVREKLNYSRRHAARLVDRYMLNQVKQPAVATPAPVKQEDKLDRVLKALEKFKPKQYQGNKTLVKRVVASDRVFVVGAFDWHFGALAEKKHLTKGKEWNIAEATKAVHTYIEKIKQTVTNDKIGFDRCVVLFGGDLYHTLTGFTSNGTMLKTEGSGDTQFEAVMQAMIDLIDQMEALFNKVEVHFVRGNHGGVTDIPLGYAVKHYYRNSPKVKFNLYSQRIVKLEVGPVLMLLEHGASDQTKSMVPRQERAKENYIQSILLQDPSLLVNKKQKIFVMGDLHHYRQTEFSEFEFFQFGALPKGDVYADAKNLHSRARQNCMIIGDTGVESVLHFYLD